MRASREIELDDDGWWTVWEDGDHIAMCLTEDEARRFVADLELVEAAESNPWAVFS